MVDQVVEVPRAIGLRVTDPTTKTTSTDDEVKSKGVAVEVIHWFLDELWNYGSQQVVTPDELLAQLTNNHTNNDESEHTETIEGEADTDNISPEDKPDDEESKQDDSQVDDQTPEAEQDDSNELNSEMIEETKSLEPTPDHMDELIKRNFVFCFVRHIKDDQLPLEPSQLQSDYMYKYEHKEMGKVDFKKSNYKKITKFLKVMKKLKLCNIGKVKGKDHELILEFNRNFHKRISVDISGFRKIIVEDTDDSKTNVEETKGAPNKSYPLVEIQETFKINSKQLEQICTKAGEKVGRYYSVNDIRDIITKYINDNELNHGSQKNHVYLDPYLTKLIANQKDIKKDGHNKKPIVNKGIIFKNIELFLKPFHVTTKLNVVAKDVQKVKNGYIPKVKVVTEKFICASTRHNITRVLGLETWEIDFKDAVKVFTNKLAVGVSICQSEKSYAFEHVKIQGIHPERVEYILIDEFAVPRKQIEHINILKGKKKNKNKKK